tara:strand:- start:586 stop:1275 length:690 start_codon:yes stop_codon:yes gene_type:complete
MIQTGKEEYMNKLVLNNLYSRKDVHGIFSSETKFTPAAGAWGLRGIVKIPEKQGDFVFFVTYGRSWGGHKFDEGITSDGVLSWQSQPKQNFKSKVIQALINHDETVNNIYLFLREEKKGDYKYLGKLKYLNHDREREHPVYFQWQLLDFKSLDSVSQTSSVEQSKEKIQTFLKKSDPYVGFILTLFFGFLVLGIFPFFVKDTNLKITLMSFAFVIWTGILIYRTRIAEK